MLAELKNSTEPRELVKRAQEYLRGIIGGIVRKKKEIESKKNASSGATPLNEPQTAKPGMAMHLWAPKSTSSETTA